MAEIQIANRTFSARYIIGFIVVIILVIGTIIGIYNYQKNLSAQKQPTIEIYKPNDNQEVAEAQIIIEGKTNPDSKVKVNNIETNVDKKGNFAAEVPLKEGKNIITTEAISKNGKNVVAERNVLRVTPKPITTTTQNPSTATGVSGSTALNNSGPENFWLPEASMLAAAGTAWIAARKRLSKISKGKV